MTGILENAHRGGRGADGCAAGALLLQRRKVPALLEGLLNKLIRLLGYCLWVGFIRYLQGSVEGLFSRARLLLVGQGASICLLGRVLLLN
jgi:hypothetical protein